MRHRKRGQKLHRKTGPRGLLIRGMTIDAILHDGISTTAGKARSVQSFLERCITISRDPSLQARRRLLAKLANDRAVRKLLEVFGPRYRQRPGGYTRLTKTGRRAGDGAPTVRLDLVE
jgi:large subunit ribosomal protein L17